MLLLRRPHRGSYRVVEQSHRVETFWFFSPQSVRRPKPAKIFPSLVARASLSTACDRVERGDPERFGAQCGAMVSGRDLAVLVAGAFMGAFCGATLLTFFFGGGVAIGETRDSHST